MFKISPEIYIKEYWKLQNPYPFEREVYFLGLGMKPPKHGRPRRTNRNAMAQR